MSHYKQYPAYKSSNIPEISLIPEGWSIKRLKHHADFFNSNVDKKSYEDGIPTLLCNYTDVYYNEFISPDLPFMEATASESEIQRFTLKAGDVIITKDSEDPWDIGVPAMVKEDMPGVVCGYHLTMIRAKDLHTSRFIHRLLQSLPVKSYLAVNSPGITRFGLGQDVIGSLPVPTPPTELFKTIADKIDRETTRIDALIAKKTQFIELLKEKRQTLITHAVTKGLTSNVKMKDSGVEWIGEVPEHWTIGRLKDLVKGGFTYGANESGLDGDTDGPRYIRITDINSNGTLNNGSVKKLDRITAQPYLLKDGDILLARSGATVGKSFQYREDMGPACYAGYLIKVTPADNTTSDFLSFFFQSSTYWEFIGLTSIQATIENVSAERYASIPLVIPPLVEQVEISNYLVRSSQKIDLLRLKTQRSIDLLRERRSAFITAAVTGQIDLREEK